MLSSMTKLEQDPSPEDDQPIPEDHPFGELIYTYTRAQAIADGLLVDVTERAKEVGFKVPVAITASVYHQYVQVPEGVTDQNESGRLWDICTMLHYAISQSADSGPELLFKLHVRNHEQAGPPPLVELKCHSGPGDHGEHVLTILTPDED